MKVIGSALGIDEPEEEIYKWLYENIGRHAEDLARFGLFGTLGINIKGSLAIGGIPDIPTNLVDLAGAPGSVVMDVYHGLENITKGDVSKGLEKIAPLAIGNPIKAYREYTEGLTTRSNTPLYFGNKQVKADMTDALLRTFSFNPAKIARVREIQWSEKQKERKYREMKSDINRRIKAFYVQPIADRGKGEWADILEDIREYNLRISKAGMVGTVPLITAKSIASFVRRSFKPPKRERMRQVR